MAPKICSECGAELELGPARCPLCGTEPAEPTPAAKPRTSVDNYQSDIRKLRAQLKRLRSEDAEAV